MIRRNLTFEDGSAGWLLVSQVEHARVSGEIARAWREQFSQDVVDAITHHDDGWAEWEAAPQLDPARGRPLSFVEMPIVESLQIWNRSIEAAHRFGDLAGAIVAGHFLGLASGSDQAQKPLVAHWSRGWSIFRLGWTGEWESRSDANTPRVFERAQQMLMAADLLSLWLCMDGPVLSAGDESLPNQAQPNREMQSRSATVLGKYRFEPQAKSLSATDLEWRGSLAPWPFTVEELELAAPARAVRAKTYANWQAIVAESRPFELRWRLRQTLPASTEC
jgi:hypothetical protein